MGGSANAASIASHWDGLDLLGDILKELLGALELPAVDRLGSLAGVLERNTEVRAAGAGGLRRLDFGRSVSNLWTGTTWSVKALFGSSIALCMEACRSQASHVGSTSQEIQIGQ